VFVRAAARVRLSAVPPGDQPRVPVDDDGRAEAGPRLLTARRIGRGAVLAQLAIFIAVPVALTVLGSLLPIFGAFDRYALQVGVRLPHDPSNELVLRFAGDLGRGGSVSPGGDVLLDLNATEFQQIRRIEYVVRPGDTISEIAHRHDLETGTILSMNPINDVRRLLPGTRLSIPDRDGLFHGVQPGESLESIARAYKLPLYSILDANNLDTDVLQVGDTLFIPGARMPDNQYLLAIGELLTWPVRNYRFTSGYGMRSDPITRVWRMHTGIDLANAIGTPVLAAGPGRVVHRESSNVGYGNVLILDHGNGVRTLYAHLESFAVAVGQWVNRGQLIARMGNTGRSTGPHLHFSVSRHGRWEDPMRHLRR
jgi:murein DD-endopeptidase MepM/ murein hydrolase activator NlpD